MHVPISFLLVQVVELKASNGDLEERVAKLVTSNEKLADDEGRWYSLARELENQMDVIKKVRPNYHYVMILSGMI